VLQNSWLFPHRPFDAAGFLTRIGSPRLHDMPLADWIPDAAQAYNIREEWLLGLIQKEQSGLTEDTLSQHARDWLCGYGYTEGPIYSRYRGAKNQVYSAARGLRRYLTPSDSLYVGDWVDTPRTFDGETRVVRNLAEACALQYTPHWSTLQTVERIWRTYGFEDSEGMASLEDVARVAEAAGRAGDAGKSRYEHNGIIFDLDERGYCARFVRQVHEAALNTGAWNWPHNAPHARAMERKLEAAGLRVTDPKPGDIVAVNGGGGQYGHIAIFIGGGRIAENTSSTSRGPGTTISALSDVASRVTGYYRAAPEAVGGYPPEITVVALPGYEHTAPARLIDDEYHVRLRDVAKLMERELATEHIKSQKKAYLKEAAND
jgi:hypothetical protein